MRLEFLPIRFSRLARLKPYSADHYFHHYYWYGENEKSKPLAEDHRKDDLLELAAEPVKDVTKYKHYEGGRTTIGVGKESGFAVLCLYCAPPPRLLLRAMGALRRRLHMWSRRRVSHEGDEALRALRRREED